MEGEGDYVPDKVNEPPSHDTHSYDDGEREHD